MASSIPMPASIGKYRITGLLGQGAMGMVYKGFDPHINRVVAIKTIHKNLLGDGDAVDSVTARFRNEAQAVGRIAHPGVVAIYELGQDERTAFIVMEFVDGRGLDQVLRGSPLLPEAQLLSIMDQLLDALGAAHRHGVWHRDIKPANLMLTATGLLKLTDFGIARIKDAGLTQVAVVIGSPGYMAPEQYRGRIVDHRADLFAAGVLLYRLLVGRLPFTGTAEQLMYQIINETPPPPSQVAPHRSAAYDDVMLRALAKDSAQRFASAAEFREALSAAAIRATHEDFATTLMVPRQQWAETLAAAPPSRPIQTNTSSSGAPAPTGWDAPALQVLTQHLGPIAKIVLKRAAQQAPAEAAFVQAVLMACPELDAAALLRELKAKKN